MKILAIICEFNPLHNGHAYLIGQAKRQSGCDATVCVMSGSFTQRGDICRNDKYTRARHAVLSGADAVIELPAPFAVAPAEIFARGAVKTVCSIPGVCALAFGHESGNKSDFLSVAEILNEESGQFKATLDYFLNCGESFIKGYCAAFELCGGDKDFLSAPNNILGVEYTKAIKTSGKNIEIVPIKRIGAGFNDGELKSGYSSAEAIRENCENPAIADNMPPYSYRDFTAAEDNGARFKRLAADWLYLCDKESLKQVCGCSEGLENRLKSSAFGSDYGGIVEDCSGKRYTRSRIKRILAANLLGIYADDTQKFLNADLPLRVLAVKKERADAMLPLFAKINAEQTQLNGEAAKCFDITSRAYSLWRHLSSPLLSDNPNEKMILV